VRELSLDEQALVSGGLPHGSWAVDPTQPAASLGTDPLPHGSW
jgi:hypothetical protein